MCNLMLYSSDSGILMKGQLYRLLIMVILVEVAWMSSMRAEPISRMSSKTLPGPLVLENAHIYELLFKCEKTCSKPVSKDTI